MSLTPDVGGDTAEGAHVRCACNQTSAFCPSHLVRRLELVKMLGRILASRAATAVSRVSCKYEQYFNKQHLS